MAYSHNCPPYRVKVHISPDSSSTDGQDAIMDDKDDVIQTPDEETLSKKDEKEEAVIDKQPGIKRLYEGEPLCDCCKNWVQDCPQNMKHGTKNEWKDAAVLLRYAKSHSNNGNDPLQLHSVTIQDHRLQTIVQDVLEDFPVAKSASSDMTFEAPFEPFFHKWTRFKRLMDECKNEDDLALFKFFRDIMEDEFGEPLKQAADSLATGNVSFDSVFALFPPGTAVFIKDHGQDACGVVSSAKITSKQDATWLDLEVWLLDHGASTIAWTKTTSRIWKFDGMRHATEFDIIPREFQSDSVVLANRLLLRGKRAIDILGHPYQSYDGLITVNDPNMGSTEQYVDGRIMVDPGQFLKNQAHLRVSTRPYPLGLRHLLPASEICHEAAGHHSLDNFQERDVHQDPFNLFDGLLPQPPIEIPQKNDEDLFSNHRWTKQVFGIDPEVFYSPVVRGYCLQTKVWGEFWIDDISDIIWNENAFDMLVMSPKRKRLLQAIIEQQKTHKTEADDVVRGKGQGLNLLLSGPPGTGKTLTAESIADRLRMPLYAINASQLGDNIAALETELSLILRLAATWNAVLLLDEADAFLEKREVGLDPFGRNKSVAIFLRLLEYYKGVLILTTNRDLHFDEAFYSRIHLCFKYPHLDRESRATIWTNFLSPVTDQIGKKEVDSLAAIEMNGRQIKNVVKMARLLAQNGGCALTSEHLRDVIEIMNDDCIQPQEASM